ncbi:hypothetical protein CBR_g26029 [Chara braunii]|uniref:RRM domain-containing protein n=1 Tax=Chara braunii TaxID=69332 RepID=A0A388L779_CHABU|nr:hypothetical protein CBR_g26029 [Chara braunii]|eukprot:GBG78092.1 hypothetical protein CBR_g26029 [Chara braunii]
MACRRRGRAAGEPPAGRAQGACWVACWVAGWVAGGVEGSAVWVWVWAWGGGVWGPCWRPAEGRRRVWGWSVRERQQGKEALRWVQGGGRRQEVGARGNREAGRLGSGGVLQRSGEVGKRGRQRRGGWGLKLKLKIVNTKARALNKDGCTPSKAEDSKAQNLSLSANKKSAARSKEFKQPSNKKVETVDPVSCPSTRSKRRLSSSSADFIPFRKGRRSKAGTSSAAAPPQKGRGYRSGSVSSGPTTPTKGSWSLSSPVPMVCSSRGKKPGNVHSRREKEKLTERELHFFEYEEIEIEQYDEDQEFEQILQLSGDGEGCLHHFSDIRQYEELVAEESSPAPAYVTQEGEDIQDLWPLEDELGLDDGAPFLAGTDGALQTPYGVFWSGRKPGQVEAPNPPAESQPAADCMPGGVPIDFSVDDGWLASAEFDDHGYRIQDAGAVDVTSSTYILPVVSDRASPVHHAAYLIPEIDEKELQHLPLVDSPFADIADVDASCALNGFTEGEPRATQGLNGVPSRDDLHKGKPGKEGIVDQANFAVDGISDADAPFAVERGPQANAHAAGVDGVAGETKSETVLGGSSATYDDMVVREEKAMAEDTDAMGMDPMERAQPGNHNNSPTTCTDSGLGQCYAAENRQLHRPPPVKSEVWEKASADGGCQIKAVASTEDREAGVAVLATETKAELEGPEAGVSQVLPVKTESIEMASAKEEKDECGDIEGKGAPTASGEKLCPVLSSGGLQDQKRASEGETARPAVFPCPRTGQHEVMVLAEVVARAETTDRKAPNLKAGEAEPCEEATHAAGKPGVPAFAALADVQTDSAAKESGTCVVAASETKSSTGLGKDGDVCVKLEAMTERRCDVSQEKAEGSQKGRSGSPVTEKDGGASRASAHEDRVQRSGSVERAEEMADAKQDLETVRFNLPSMNAERDMDMESKPNDPADDGRRGASPPELRGRADHEVASGAVSKSGTVDSVARSATAARVNQRGGTDGSGSKFVSSEVHAVGRSEWDSDEEEDRDRYWERSRNADRDKDWDQDGDWDRAWEHRSHSSRSSRDRYGRPYESGRSYDRSESGAQRSDRRYHYSERRPSYREESYRSERSWERTRERCGRRRWRDHSAEELFGVDHERSHSSSRGWEAKRQKKRGKGPSQDCTIFVGDLDPSTIDYELNLAFERFGEIVRARVIEAQCYGFVTFESRQCAETAVSQGKSEEGVYVGSQRVRVAWAHGSLPDWKIGVGGFAWTAPLPASPGGRERRFSDAKQFPMESGGVRVVLPPPAKAGPKASLMAAAAAAAATAVAVLSSGPEVPCLDQQQPLPQGRQIIAYDDLF